MSEHMPYWKQLQDPRWQEVRLKILERASFSCECCGDKPEGESLEIHHRYYEKGKMAWEYNQESLVCACRICHQEIAESERILLESIDPRDLKNITDFAVAISAARHSGVGLKQCSEWICENVKQVIGV